MEHQTRSLYVEIVSESLKQFKQDQLKSHTDLTDTAINVKSDDDSGFLNRCEAENDTTVCKELPYWRLKSLPEPEVMTNDQVANLVKSAYTMLDSMPVGEGKKHAMDLVTEAYGNVLPESLLAMLTAFVFDGDSGVSMDIKPEWLDMEKFRRGQKFAMDNLAGLFYMEILGLFMVYSFHYGLKSLLVTGNSSTPYASFKRYDRPYLIFLINLL